ncbi:AMIN domain-containing protein [Helicobacter sp. T3_23-1059]
MNTFLKLLCVLFVFVVIDFANARENPFEPMSRPQEDTFKSPNAKNYFKERDIKLPSTARILKTITITYQNIDGSTESKSIDIDEGIDWHFPILLSQKKAFLNEKVQHYTIVPFDFFTQRNRFYLFSSNNIIRSFVLPSPYRIVIDIDKQEQYGLQKQPKSSNGFIPLNVKYFTKAALDVHKDFYRFTITLDGQYTYHIQKEVDYYVILVE